MTRVYSDKPLTVYKPILSSIAQYTSSSKRSASCTPNRVQVQFNQDMLSQWEEIKQLFPNLTHKSISTYADSNLYQSCTVATQYFAKIVDANLPEEYMSEDMLKILVVCFQHFSNCCISKGTTKQLICNLAVLNSLLIASLESKKALALIKQYDTLILQIVSKTLNSAYTLFNKAIRKDTAANFLYCQYQALATVIAFNERKHTNRVANIEFISNAFGVFESAIKVLTDNSLLKDIFSFPLGEHETWVNERHIKLASVFNRVKFHVVQLGLDECKPTFSLRYLCLYYIWKIFQLVLTKKGDALKKRVIELIKVILKSYSEELSLPVNSKKLGNIRKAEGLLNEVLISFMIIEEIFRNIRNFFELLYNSGCSTLLNSSIHSYVFLALEFKLLSVEEPSLKVSSVITSCKTSNDYLAGVFRLLNVANNNRNARSYEESVIVVLAAFEEVLEKLISRVDEGPEGRVLTDYIVEYLFDNRNAVSRKAAEFTVKLIETKIIHYTAPSSLMSNLKLAEPMKELTNKRIMLLLKQIIEDDKKWAETILKHLIELIKSMSNKNETLFGLCKLLYCSVSGEIHNNDSFFKLVFADYSTVINYTMYATYGARGDSRAVRGFIDVKGLAELASIMDGVGIIKNLILKLVDLPAIAEELIVHPQFILKLLKGFESEFTFILLHKLMVAAKYSAKELYKEFTDINNYLPIALISYMKEQLQLKIQSVDVINYLKLIGEFFVQESGAPSIKNKQLILKDCLTIEEMVNILLLNSNSPNIGKLIEFMLKLLYGIILHNEEASAYISNSMYFNKSKFSNFLAKMVRMVNSS